MKAILYYSSAAIELNDTRAWEIAHVSASQNEVFDVTGYLCFYNTYFFQYIEGPDNRVSRIMEKIQSDDRHSVIQTFEELELRTRRFPHWRMRYVHWGSLPETSLEKAIVYPLGGRALRLSDKASWTTALAGTLTRISGLHKAGECVESIERSSTVH
ncbi:MAG: BLUF domain-containing protein [Pseudomonadota bacterium]